MPEPRLPPAADGELHPAGRHHQGLLHGLLLSGRQAARFPLHPQPVWQWEPPGLREVSLRVGVGVPPGARLGRLQEVSLPRWGVPRRGSCDSCCRPATIPARPLHPGPCRSPPMLGSVEAAGHGWHAEGRERPSPPAATVDKAWGSPVGGLGAPTPPPCPDTAPQGSQGSCHQDRGWDATRTL